MPDWKALVRGRIGSLDLPQAARDEVIAELAAHLEDIYEEQVAAGAASLKPWIAHCSKPPAGVR